MRFVAKPVSHHRLQRFHRWAMLWLMWFAAFLEVATDFAPLSRTAQTIGHLWLDKIERLIVCIVIVRAASRIRQLNRRKCPGEHRSIGTSFFRAVIGSRMRHMLRSRDLHQRIAALRVNIDELVARLLKRLPCGLTRRRPILARPESKDVPTARIAVVCALLADTS